MEVNERRKKIIMIIKLFKYLIIKILFLFLFFIFLRCKFRKGNKKLKYKKRVGIIGLEHSWNIGNNLLKYAISIKVSELGFDPYIVGRKILESQNLSFIFTKIKYRLINNSFNEIKKDDYDILMVNSDQTWRNWHNDTPSEDPFFYDVAFLRFSQNWSLPKFVYGASLGVDYWKFNKEDDNIAKYLLKNFSEISTREKGSIKLIKNHLGYKAKFVLDPTLLINKNYYLDLIKDFKDDIIVNDNYIAVYTITDSIFLKNYIDKINNYKKYLITCSFENGIKKFIYGISNCKGVITDSYHGTLFSIIFNKPFISFELEVNGNERFNTLKDIFNLTERIFELKSNPDNPNNPVIPVNPDIKLLEKPLKINQKVLNSLKMKSINFLKRNLKNTIF